MLTARQVADTILNSPIYAPIAYSLPERGWSRETAPEVLADFVCDHARQMHTDDIPAAVELLVIALYGPLDG